jgi:hypothetical protein
MENKLTHFSRTLKKYWKISHFETETLMWIGIFLLLVLSFGVFAYKNSLFFEGIPINWAFQHFNPLRRLFHGEIPGVDFIVFHGTGLTLIFAPLFALFGGNLFASEFSRFFLSWMSIFLVFFLFFQLVIRRSFFSSVVFSLVFLLFFHYSRLFWLLDPYGPAYSSLGVRTFFPLAFLFLVYFFSPRFEPHPIRLGALLGFAFAGTIFFSTEQGIALFLSLAGGILFFLGKNWKEKSILLFTYVGFSILFFLIILFLYSFGHIGKPLVFLFHDIPIDQIWYFWAPPNRILTSIFDLYVSVTDIVIIKQLIVFLGAGVLLLFFSISKKFLRLDSLDRFFLWTLFFYGCISISSNLGMYSPHYFEVSTRVGILIMLFICFWYIKKLPNNLWRHYISLFIFSFSIALLLLWNQSIWKNISQIRTDSHALDLSSEPKVSGSYLTKGIWDNYISSLASTIGTAGKELQIDTSYSDTLWKYGIARFSSISAPQSRLEFLSSGDRLIISGKEYLLTKLSREAGTIQVSGILPIGPTEDITKKDRGKYAYTVSTSPFYTTADTTNSKLQWFTNGVKIDPNTGIVSILLETRYDVQVGDEVTFSDGQKADIGLIDGNILVLTGQLLQIQPYLHGYPQKITIHSRQNSNEVFSGGISVTTNVVGFRIENFEDLSSYRAGDVIMTEWGDECMVRHIEWGNLFCNTGNPEKFSHEDTIFIDYRDTHIGKDDLWSTYAWIAEEYYHVFQPTGTDYLIHILGPDARKQYLETFREKNPRFVQTIRPDYMAYERWLQLTTWGFYEDVLRKYFLKWMTGYSLIWERRETPLMPRETTWETIEFDGKKEVRNISIPGGTLSWKLVESWATLVIRVHYSIKNRYEKIPILWNSPRYILTPLFTETTLPISLPPYESSWEFPLYVSDISKWIELRVSQINPISFIRWDFLIDWIEYKYVQFDKQSSEALFLNRYGTTQKLPLTQP